MADISDILKGVVEQKPLDIQTAVSDLMLDKIRDVVADRKAELANHFLNVDTPEDLEDDETPADETEETADEIEAEADEIGDDGDDTETPTEDGDQNAEAE